MLDDIIFRALALRHIETNLENWLKYAKPDTKSQTIVYSDGHDLFEGQENKEYEGILIVRNGDHLMRELIADKLIEDELFTEPEAFTDETSLAEYFEKRSIMDGPMQEGGSYLINSARQTITEVSEFGVGASALREGERFKNYLPKDFISQTQYIDPDLPKKIGMKTKAAIRLCVHPPKGLGITVYQIKRSRYGNAGMGIVTQFGHDGLERTIHLEYRPGTKDPTVEVKDKRFHNSIVMVYREYARNDNNEIVCSKEQIVDASKPLHYWFESSQKYDDHCNEGQSIIEECLAE